MSACRISSEVILETSHTAFKLSRTLRATYQLSYTPNSHKYAVLVSWDVRFVLELVKGLVSGLSINQHSSNVDVHQLAFIKQGVRAVG